MSGQVPPGVTPEWLRAEAASWRENFGSAGDLQGWAFELAADALEDRLALAEAVELVLWTPAIPRAVAFIVASLARFSVEATPLRVLEVLEVDDRFYRDPFDPQLWWLDPVWRHRVALVDLIEAYLLAEGEPRTLADIASGIDPFHNRASVAAALAADDRFVFDPEESPGFWRLRRPEDPR